MVALAPSLTARRHQLSLDVQPGQCRQPSATLSCEKSCPCCLECCAWRLFTLTQPAWATLYRQHGYSLYGQPKYPANFEHLDYVNPDAPKGGTLRVMGSGTFDTLNPYTLKGTSPINTGDFGQFGISELNEPLMVGSGVYDPSGDEPYSAYGLIAESLEFADNRSWVVFNLRPEARFHDGEPITAEDVAFSYRLLK